MGEYAFLLFSLLGALAVAAGLSEPPLNVAGGAVFLAVLSAAALQTWNTVRGGGREHFFSRIAGPLLWTVAGWMGFRFLQPYSAQAVLVPAGLIAWLVAAYPAKVSAAAFLLMLFMEGGLLVMGHQSAWNLTLNLSGFGTVALASAFFTSSRVYLQSRRQAVIRTRRSVEHSEFARDLGFADNRAALRGVVNELSTAADPENGNGSVVEMVDEAFSLQLEILRQSLRLSSVVILWPDPDLREFRLRSAASARKDLKPGPFQVGAGITGVLTGEKDEIVLAPVPVAHPPLPYYKEQGEVGGIAAVRIPGESFAIAGEGGKRISPILCADRISTRPWAEEELEAFRLTAMKIGSEVRMGRQLLTMFQERSAIHLLCLGMHELNGALGLEQVLAATVRAVKRLTRTDFIAITLAQDARHRVGAVEGDRTGKLQGMEFSLDEGLAGQALKIRHSLPARAQGHGPVQVFGEGHKLTGYKSLLVIPLLKGEGNGIGTLTVASREEGIFDRSRRDILELIAAQVAIKIDLGQAHEQINKLATTDGLTGLANHRTFQHGFDVMLQRAERRKGSLCLVLCDIDHFKKVNDTYGHPFGDKVLKGVSEILLKAVRSLDLAARYGGEEFAIVLEDADGKGGCLMAERIRKEIEQKVFLYQREPIGVTVSLGLAVYPDHAREKSALISLADQALYRAKQQGRNRLVCWTS